MTTRFPLYAKILLWFFLNLIVLAAAGFIFLSAQFRLGAEFIVSAMAGERLQAISVAVRNELAARPRTEWDGILQRFGAAYHAQLLLYRNDGTQFAGERMPLPAAVAQRLPDPRAPRREGPPPPEMEPFDDAPPPNGPAPAPLESDGPPGAPGFRGDRVNAPMPPVRFVVRAGNPALYWIGLPMRRGAPGPMRGPGPPATLLFVSRSLNAGGLVVDWTIWAWLGIAAVLFSVLFWLPLVRGITRSISQMQAATSRIAEGKFDVRVDERRQDELGALGSAINRMAGRLDGFITGQKRFLGDIAHELCSPLARLQMALGILEQRAGESDAARVQDVRDEVEQMSALVNELLSFSKASLGSTALRAQAIDLQAIVDKAIQREMRDGAEIRNDVPTGLTALADPELVVRAVANLLRNAVRYAGGAGPIVVSAGESDSGITLRVADSGPGVPEGEVPKLFDPFYRVDTARTRETGGVGLGLAIVKTCVESCGGSVACRNRARGFEVTMTLPRPAGQDPAAPAQLTDR